VAIEQRAEDASVDRPRKRLVVRLGPELRDDLVTDLYDSLPPGRPDPLKVAAPA